MIVFGGGLGSGGGTGVLGRGGCGAMGMERLKRMFDTGDGRQAEGAIDRESALSGLGYVNIDVAAVHREIVPKHHETSESVSTASRTQLPNQ